MSHAQMLIRAPFSRLSLLGVLLASCFGASAQTADPVAPFLGTWSGVFTTQENEYWTFADIQCFVGCPKDFYDHLSGCSRIPANDATPAFALSGQSRAASLAALDAMLTPLGKQVRAANKPENDPKFLNCQPYGFVREVTNPLPMQISRDGDHLLVRYEEWSLLRPSIWTAARTPRTDADLARAFRGARRGRRADRGNDACDAGLDLGYSQAGHSGELTASNAIRCAITRTG